MDLKPGTVLLWHEFNIPNYLGKIKPVLFVFLGQDSILECEIYIHLHRFTSKIKDHPLTIRFSCGEYGIFDCDCILDFNEKPYPIENNYYQENISKIKPLGLLPEDIIRRIWNCIKKSNFYSKKTRSRIRDYLYNHGIIVDK